MGWQGVPFLFDQSLTTNDLVIALSRVPKIVVDSPPDYTNLAVTALVSLVAGLFPALIAVWTFRRNAENVKIEREKQQEFLREERRNQQDFLEADRKKQQESFEEDRKTQIEVAKTNFNMQVLSGNRQDWINNLREVVAEYNSLAPRLIDLCCSYKIQKDCVDIYILQHRQEDPYSRTDEFSQKFKLEKDALSLCTEKLNVMIDRVSFLQAKIKMMLNPKEIEYKSVIESFAFLSKSRTLVCSAEKVLDVYSEEYSKTLDSIQIITSLMQAIFKREWERVKTGV